MIFKEKNLIYLLLLLFCASCKDNLEPLPINLTITSQEDLDRYRSALMEIDTFEGNIVIAKGFQNLSGSSITDISSLSELVQINGDLSIVDYVGKNLADLSNLQAVKGSLTINSKHLELVKLPELQEAGSILVSFCPLLKSISMENLSSVGTSIVISNNSTLQQIDGFHAITQLQKLDLSNNPALNKLAFFDNLQSITDLFNFECYQVMDLDQPNLNNLSYVSKLQLTVVLDDGIRLDWLDLDSSNSITIRGNINLEDLCDLKKIAEDNPDAISINRFDDGLFYFADDLLQNCN